MPLHNHQFVGKVSGRPRLRPRAVRGLEQLFPELLPSTVCVGRIRHLIEDVEAEPGQALQVTPSSIPSVRHAIGRAYQDSPVLDYDVLLPEVCMRDAEAVPAVERAGRINGDPEGVGELQRLHPGQVAWQRLAGGIGAHIVDGTPVAYDGQKDVRVTQLLGISDRAYELFTAYIVSQVGVNQLDRDAPAGARVASQEHAGDSGAPEEPVHGEMPCASGG